MSSGSLQISWRHKMLQMLEECGDIVLCCWIQCALVIEEHPCYDTLCSCVPLWARTCAGSLALIRLMSWNCVWAGTWEFFSPSSVSADMLHHTDTLYCCIIRESRFCIHYLRSRQLCLCIALMLVTHGISCKLRAGQTAGRMDQTVGTMARGWRWILHEFIIQNWTTAFS